MERVRGPKVVMQYIIFIIGWGLVGGVCFGAAGFYRNLTFLGSAVFAALWGLLGTLAAMALSIL